MAVTYSHPHWLITVQGDSWTLTETWQFGVRALPVAVFPSDVEAQNVANTLAAPTQAMFTAANLFISNNCRLTGIKVALIQTNGKYAPDHVPGQYTYVTPPIGASANNTFPQITQCVTLHTPTPRGRASKGRFFLPPHSALTQADGRLTAAVVDGMEATVRTWLLAVNAVAEIASVEVHSGLGAGVAHVVDRISIGRVVDTMRSRRRSLPEGRTTLAL